MSGGPPCVGTAVRGRALSGAQQSWLRTGQDGAVPARTSAGILLYRLSAQGRCEVLLGHMGGPFWARKDDGAWSIPKGEHGPDEDPRVAAVREFTEEIGQAPPDGPDVALGTVRQRGGKSVTVWARRGDLDVTTIARPCTTSAARNAIGTSLRGWKSRTSAMGARRKISGLVRAERTTNTATGTRGALRHNNAQNVP